MICDDRKFYTGSKRFISV